MSIVNICECRGPEEPHELGEPGCTHFEPPMESPTNVGGLKEGTPVSSWDPKPSLVVPPGPPQVHESVTEPAIKKWTQRLFAASGVQTCGRFSDGTLGVLNLSGRAIQVINALQVALVAVAEGEELPKIVVEKPKKKKRR